MNTPQVILVSTSTGDWEALYINGKKVDEGHSLRVTDVLSHLGIKCEEFEVLSNDDEGCVEFTENLKDVKFTRYGDCL